MHSYEQIYAEYADYETDEYLDHISIVSQSPPQTLDEYTVDNSVPPLLGYDYIPQVDEHCPCFDLNCCTETFDTVLNLQRNVDFNRFEKSSSPNLFLIDPLNREICPSEYIANMSFHMKNLSLNKPSYGQNIFTCHECKSQSEWIKKRKLTPKYISNNSKSTRNTDVARTDIRKNEFPTECMVIPVHKKNAYSHLDVQCTSHYPRRTSCGFSSNSSFISDNETSKSLNESSEKTVSSSPDQISDNSDSTNKMSMVNNYESPPVMILPSMKRYVKSETLPYLPKNSMHRKRHSLTPKVNLTKEFEITPSKRPAISRRRYNINFPSYDISNANDITDIGFVDTHCHLDFLFQRESFQGTYAKYQRINSATFPKCYEGCITVFCDPSSFFKKCEWETLLKEDSVWGAFGCHPHMAGEYNDEIEQSLQEAIKHPRVVALGEIGLDYSSKNSCDANIQQEVFRRQIRIAIEQHLPLVIHCRDADEDCIQILKEEVPVDYYIHRHCFTSTWNEAEIWLDTFPNLYLGLTCLVTFPSAADVHEVAKRIPLDRLLLETDAPYFIPKNNSVRDVKFSHPGMALHVAAQISALRPRTTVRDILLNVRRNTNRIYRV